ncbi:hypothetical protein C1646_751840 [Rhizophagus diaphanus]|nr:hypothetical protein C1646_751840 [Rhizophagus diaphanus] [Rhizophagus sp. MUCL 43196]
MSRNSSVYFILWILIQVLVKVNCQMTPFKPSVHSHQTATLIDNKLYILGGYELPWQDLSNINMVPLHSSATAYCLGGDNDYTITYNSNTLNINQGTALTLSEIYIYDIINDNWDTKATSGKIPSNRGGFSTVLSLDGKRVIIFGGYFINPGYLDTTLYVLNLTNYNWYIPKISGKIPKPRAFHKANVIGKYMVVSFGVGYDKTVESDILLLDISNNEEYIWTTIFDPKMPPPQQPPLPPSSGPSLSSDKIAGIIVGSLLSGILLLVGSFLIYKWNKNKQKTIYENDNNNDYSQEEKELPIIRDIQNYEQDNNNNEQETIQIDQIPRNESTSNEPMIIPPPIINKNNYHKQEIILTPENENTTNHEPIIIPVNNHHGQEIMQTLQNETSDHELTIPAPEVVNDTNNYKYGQEVIPTPNNNRISSQIFKEDILQAVKNEIGQNLKNGLLQAVKNEIGQNLKNELLQAVKNEIGQNLKNELLQAVREDNLNITRNSTKQD